MDNVQTGEGSGAFLVDRPQYFKRNTDPTISILEIMCKTLDISLSQFFDVDEQGGLTADQRRMLDMWGTLNERERAAVLEMIELLLAHK